MTNTTGRKWSVGECVEVSGGGLTDEYIWNELSLALIINRHCSEVWSDDQVSSELWRVWNATRLPWEIVNFDEVADEWERKS